MDKRANVSVSEYPNPPVWCPSCAQAMRYHPEDIPGTRLRFRCTNCQWTWTTKDVIEAEGHRADSKA